MAQKTPPKTTAKNGITARQKLFKTFSIDYTSPVDDRRYIGKFTTKKLTISDVATLGVRKAQLNGGMHHDASSPGMGVDAATDNLNSMIAHLDVCLEEVPEWWNLADITDADLLALVFEEVVKHESSFHRSAGERNQLRGSEDGDDALASSEDVGTADQEEAHHDRERGQVVDKEVPASLEP